MAEISKTVDQALRVLAELGEGGAGSTADLARRAGINRTVVHRLLATLERHGFVRRQDGRFDLGFALVALGRAVDLEVREAAGPALERLAEQASETAVLAVPDGDSVVAVEQVVSARQPLQVRYRPGYRHSLARGAHGRAILAFADETLVAEVLRHGGGRDLPRQLAGVRERGFATSHDELEVGTSGLAAPVHDHDGRVVASIGVVVPTPRLEDEAGLAARTLAAAADVTRRLASGWGPSRPRAGAA